MEPRKKIRLPLLLHAVIRFEDGRCLVGTSMEIGLGGTYVLVDDRPAANPGARCQLELALPNTSNTAPGHYDIRIDSEVAHRDETGIGLRFRHLAPDDYRAFIRLMIEHSPDIEQLFDELNNDPGLRPH